MLEDWREEVQVLTLSKVFSLVLKPEVEKVKLVPTIRLQKSLMDKKLFLLEVSPSDPLISLCLTLFPVAFLSQTNSSFQKKA